MPIPVAMTLENTMLVPAAMLVTRRNSSGEEGVLGSSRSSGPTAARKYSSASGAEATAIVTRAKRRVCTTATA